MYLLFFFSSRRRHTRWTGDWSSDVCSSDLSLIRVTNRRIQSKKSLDRFPSPMGEGILDQSPLCQIAHQVAYSERPGRAFMAAPHAVGETSELCRGNGDDVAILVGEALALGVAIFDRCEHRAEEQHKTVRI